MLDTKQFSKILQNDNELVANNIMNVIRQNLDLYDVGADKAKFLEAKKKEILAIDKNLIISML